ncbi:hypothetical protein ACJX0J_038594 [Zea mays]
MPRNREILKQRTWAAIIWFTFGFANVSKKNCDCDPYICAFATPQDQLTQVFALYQHPQPHHHQSRDLGMHSTIIFRDSENMGMETWHTVFSFFQVNNNKICAL